MLQRINLIQEGCEFKNATVYMSGNAFYDCRFFRCTLVVREGGIPELVGCTFECCIWHLDVLVNDHRMWESFAKAMFPLIRDSLPRAFVEGGGGGTVTTNEETGE